MSSSRVLLTILGTLALACVFMYERGVTTSWNAGNVTLLGLCISAALVGAFAGFAMAEHMNAANVVLFAIFPPIAFTYGYFQTLSLEVIVQALMSIFPVIYLSFFAAYVLVCLLLRGLEEAAQSATSHRTQFDE